MNSYLKYKESFEHRHSGPFNAEKEEMLKTIGAKNLDALIDNTVPAHIRRKDGMPLPETLSEAQLLQHLKELGAKNKINKSFIGQGYYNCNTPGVILRNILENPGWYTQYTPYQAEIAQGRLEALLNYQTMICDLTGMDISNASLLDEGTAAAEAMVMLHSLKGKENGEKFFVSDLVFAQTGNVLETRAEPLGIEIVYGNPSTFEPSKDYFGVLVQYPDRRGEIKNFKPLVEKLNAVGCTMAVCADLLSLTVLEAPGTWGADVVVGSAQRFGVPMGFGGPHAAFFATKDEYKRQMPGRIIGVSIDAQGDYALRMALQTREQHIKREKATSNICTSQVLLAIMASMYSVYHGPKGLKDIAMRTHALTALTAKNLKAQGYEVINDSFFDTLSIVAAEDVKLRVQAAALGANSNFSYFYEGEINISLDETTRLADVEIISQIFAEAASVNHTFITEVEDKTAFNSNDRQSEYLTHPVFNSYHTEHEMLRYIKKLESRDLSLAYSMIPLGSCTMKLNATSEMEAVTWPEFGQIHPFVPADQAAGYLEMIQNIESHLCSITGFDAMSMQPNSGAQGEFAGLLVIREYHKNRGDHHRNIALIPASAHGTNPASAVLAGMQVVVTKTAPNGNIDIEDLKAKAELHSANLSCLMVTYPSTHGVFEESINELCDIIHQHGGQVYMDGANMNAQVGLTSPSLIGADVCHLNLHKTFCIPHGGGGPGMGPIGVKSHLAPFLPGHKWVKTGGDLASNSVSAAPFGSASILLISYAYIRMMGSEGLTRATKYAILNANYIMARLKDSYNVLYTGTNGNCAHEMILDCRDFKRTSGIEVEDIAKRLIDYGYHAPTVSFPVAGTLMIEPTESESKRELDKFCDAMIAIREEIREIEMGIVEREGNVLKNAPHTMKVVVTSNWDKTYSREKAAFPAKWSHENKFWPYVGKVNSTYGDRNLVCSCLPMSAYEEA